MPGRRSLAALLVAPLAAPTVARPQEAWPARSIRLVVPYPPGGTTDILARPYGEFLRQRLGQTVVMDNRPGAATNIGSEIVARAEPDGYTLLFGQGSMIGNAATGPVPPYDPRTAFEAISLVAQVPYLVAAHPGFPARDLAGLITLARANPGRWRISSAQLDFQVAQLNRRAGFELEHVGYRGGAQATSDCIAGQVEMVFALVPVLLPFVREGVLRPLGVTSAARSPVLPQTPSFAEAGAARLDSGAWYGLFGPAGTPPGIVQRLAAETAAFAADPVLGARLGGQGYRVESSTPAALQALYLHTGDEYAALVRELNWHPSR